MAILSQLTPFPAGVYTSPMEQISGKYRDRILQMMSKATHGSTVTEGNVLQLANTAILPYIDGMLDELILSDSVIKGIEHLEELLSKATGGASCMLLMEHYSNFDLPVLSYLLRADGERGTRIAEAIVAIAGMKLNEDNPIVAAFTEAYTRIVIYPSRSLAGLDPKADFAEFVRSNAINRAAMKSLNEMKKGGKLILVFPAGTRYRPWAPESKRGVREIDSYVKSFDYFCLVSVNGNVLRIQPGDMAEDLVCQDRMILEASPVIACPEFRKAARDAVSEDEDKKQAVVDEIMRKLDEMHRRNAALERPSAPECQ